METENALLLKQLKPLVTSLAFSQAAYWLNNASKEEVLGGKALIAICDTEGREFLWDLGNMTQAKDEDERSIRSPAASVYASEYSHSTAKSKNESELLRYHTLRDLPYATVLQPEAFAFVEEWLKLRDSEVLVSALLSFLRGLHSVVKVNCIFPNSLQRACYVWYSKRDFLQAAHQKPRAPAIPNLSSLSSAVSYSATRSPSPFFATQPKKNESKLLKQRELHGSTSLLRAAMSIPSFNTTYETDYALHFKQPKRTKPLVSLRSTSLGLCPDDPQS